MINNYAAEYSNLIHDLSFPAFIYCFSSSSARVEGELKEFLFRIFPMLRFKLNCSYHFCKRETSNFIPRNFFSERLHFFPISFDCTSSHIQSFRIHSFSYILTSYHRMVSLATILQSFYTISVQINNSC